METLLRITEVATFYDVHELTVRRWWYSGEIPAPIRVGRSIRWRQSDLESNIAQRTPVAQEKAST